MHKILDLSKTGVRKKPKYCSMPKPPEQSTKYKDIAITKNTHNHQTQLLCLTLEVGAWPAIPKHAVQPHLYTYLVHHAIICCPLAYHGSIYLPMWPSRDLLLMFQGFAHPQPSRTYLRSAIFLSCCVGSREHGWLRAVIKQLLPPARSRLGKAQFRLHKAEFVRCECLWLQGESCQNSSCLNCLEATNRGHPDHQPKYKLGKHPS